MNAARVFSVLAVGCVLCGQAHPAGGEEMLLTGNEELIWLIRRDSEQGGFAILAKPAGKKWRLVDEDLIGSPIAAAAVGSRLHVFFHPDGDVRNFSLSGRSSPGAKPNWPAGAAPVAACEAEDFGEHARTLVAIVPYTAAMAARRPAATAPATVPTASRPAPRQPPGLVVFRNVNGQWQPIAELPGVTVPPGGGVAAAMLNETLYVLVSAPPPGRNRLDAWTNGRWRTFPIRLQQPGSQRAGRAASDGQWRNIPLPGPVASGRPLAMVTVSGRLAILVAARLPSTLRPRPKGGSPKSGGAEGASRRPLQIATWDEQARSFVLQPVIRDGRPAGWPADNLPLGARLADKLALLWREGESLKFGTWDVNGHPVVAEDVKTAAPGRPAEQIHQYFLWGVIAAIFVFMFVFRPRTAPKPFELPANLRPASLGKRLAAGLLDLLPRLLPPLVIAISAFSVETIGEDLLLLFPALFLTPYFDQRLPDNLAYALLLGIVLYVVYCALMEKLIGATLGKKILRLKVVADEGRPLGSREAVLRNLVKIVELSLPMLPLLILFPLINRNRQRLGDMVAKTAVIDARTETLVPPAEPPRQGPQEPPQ